MLFVDLDKTLIKSDYLLESFIKYFSQDIIAPFTSFFIFIKYGREGLKKFLYEKSNISVENLPFNQKVLDIIHFWKKEFPDEKIFLISAAYHQAVEDVAKHLKCFDGWYGTKNENLKSKIKLKKIKDLTNDENFTYIGDSFEDLVIWENANKCFLVNPSKNLLKAASKVNNSIEVIENKDNNFLLEIIKTVRVHQWVKNLLIFIPAILSLKPFIHSFENMISGFFAFSFVASAFYILNDLFDIENDRVHHSKKYRSFALGTLSVQQGLFIFFFLIIISTFISINLPESFQLLLFLYAVTNFTYSKYIKKMPIIDIMTLSFLYLIRIIAGGEIADITVSNWLLTFSAFFFLFLASIKRWVEIDRLDTLEVSGRAYRSLDTKFISNLSYFSGLISVLVICLYIESQQALTFYNESNLFWFIPVILLYWILETLFKVERGQMDDDPVKYALKSKTSYISLFGLIVIFLFSLN